jgi:hypothetical protein
MSEPKHLFICVVLLRTFPYSNSSQICELNMFPKKQCSQILRTHIPFAIRVATLERNGRVFLFPFFIIYYENNSNSEIWKLSQLSQLYKLSANFNSQSQLNSRHRRSLFLDVYRQVRPTVISLLFIISKSDDHRRPSIAGISKIRKSTLLLTLNIYSLSRYRQRSTVPNWRPYRRLNRRSL